jgi:two-component system chemotaxis response regulator CheY
MPIMKGLALLQSLRSLDSYKNTPIFIVSTVNEKDTIVKAIIYGATDYILKPYSAGLVYDKLLGKLK